MITVAIIEDHQILIDALALMLGQDPEFRFQGSATTLKGGLELVERTHPDVLLLDIYLPDGMGYDLVPQVMKTSPETRVVVLTSYTNEETVMRATELGVKAFLPKSASMSDFFITLRKAVEGDTLLPPSLLIGLLERPAHSRSNSGDGNGGEGENGVNHPLTPREHEILKYLAAGKSGNRIASELRIAPMTVRTHIRNLMSKLGVHSRLEAVAFGVRHGLINP